MLVLTRKIEESVVVGETDGVQEMVKVTVLAITHGNVRLGFEVAGHVPVHRWEVWQRIHGNEKNKPTPRVVSPVADEAEGEVLSGRR